MATNQTLSLLVRIPPLLAVLLSLLPVEASPPPTCRQVLPEAGFLRQRFFESFTVRQAARLGRDGERGLVAVSYVYSRNQESYYGIRQALADGRGGVRLTTLTRIDSPTTPYAEPHRLVSSDFDGDGVDDAALLWGRDESVPMELDLFLGSPDGVYVAAARLFLGDGHALSSLVSGDFDGDGLIEVVLLAARESGTLLTRVGLRDGAWQLLGAIEPPATGALGLAVRDHDQDGIDDLVFMDGAQFTWSYGSASVPFERIDVVPLPFVPVQVVLRDDRFVLLEGWYEPLSQYAIALRVEAIHEFDSNLQRLWSAPVPPGRGFLHESLDVDGDGHQELQQGFTYGWVLWFWSNYPVGSELLWVDGDRSLRRGSRLGTQHPLLAAIDLDADGTRDFITENFSSVVQGTLPSLHDGAIASLLDEQEGWDEPSGYTVSGDFDEDGTDDLLGQIRFRSHTAIGLSNGDGTFRFTPVEIPRETMLYPIVADIDRDGHLDLASSYGKTRVAWGRGDGSFEWDYSPPERDGGPVQSYADVDGDGILEVIEQREYPPPSTLRLSRFEGRKLTFVKTIWEDHDGQLSSKPWTADLDGDGRKDIVFSRRVLEPRTRSEIYWARSLGDDQFEPAQRFPQDPLPEGLAVFEISTTDLDLDGTDDLVVQFWPDAKSQVGEIVSLRSTGTRLVVRARFALPQGWFGPGPARVLDLDGNGVPDLIDGNDDPYFEPSYASTVWWGDGKGGFEKRAVANYGVSPGALGRFRTGAGLELARVRVFNGLSANVELFLASGRVKSADEDPPSASLSLIPVVDTSTTPARFDGQWQVVTTPTDDCDDRPTVLSRFVELLELPRGAAVSFRKSRALEIRVYELPGGGSREVVLMAPDESRVRELFAAAREQSGFSFQHWGAPLRLASTSTYSPERGLINSKTRLAQRFVLGDDGRLTEAIQTHPTHDLSLAVRVRDRSGRVGVGRAPFQVLKRQALAELCAQPSNVVWECD